MKGDSENGTNNQESDRQSQNRVSFVDAGDRGEAGQVLCGARTLAQPGDRKVDQPLPGENAVNETTPTKAIDARVAYQTPRKIEGEENLYWRGAKIYARVRVDGKQCYRCTNTDKLPKARKVLAKWREDVVLRQHGIEPKAAALVRNRLTVGAVLTEYAESGYPDRSNRSKKTAVTVENERKCVQRLQAFFGMRAAVSLTLKDCDAYRKWRASGG